MRFHESIPCKNVQHGFWILGLRSLSPLKSAQTPQQTYLIYPVSRDFTDALGDQAHQEPHREVVEAGTVRMSALSPFFTVFQHSWQSWFMLVYRWHRQLYAFTTGQSTDAYNRRHRVGTSMDRVGHSGTINAVDIR